MIICKWYYIQTLIKELGLDNSSTPTGNSTYTSCQMSPEDIVNKHDTFMKSHGIELSGDDKKLPYLYWTPKLHKFPVKNRFIAGSSKCTTNNIFEDPLKIHCLDFTPIVFEVGAYCYGVKTYYNQ